MDGCSRQNPAYRPAKEEPRSGGALLFTANSGDPACSERRTSAGRREIRGEWSSPSGIFRAVNSESKLGGYAQKAVILLIALFAIAAPIVVSVSNARDKPSEGPNGIKLTAAETTGRELFAKSCSTCHTLAAVDAVSRIGPDLDVVQPPAALVLAAIQSGYAGAGQMPAAIYSGQDANDVAQFVAAVAGR